MDPLIKWPGGKSRELEVINTQVPDYDRYFEPFFGGGAVGFAEEPSSAFVNDIDTLLISFYRDTKQEEETFYNELDSIIYDWRTIEKIVPILSQVYRAIFDIELQNLSENSLLPQVENLLDQSKEQIKTITSSLKRVDSNDFNDYLISSILSKTKRIITLQQRHEKVFDEDLISDHLMTAIKSAYYTQIRNDIFNKEPTSATFFFIREFCYGSMFRFNSKGEFNIPYGGINYNTKNIEQKIQYMKSEEILEILEKFKFHNLDFSGFLDQFDLDTNDFIFLDPPYDSDFKNYGKNPFGEKDQIRLAKYLRDCEAKWMLVIKKTELIWELYSQMADEKESISILAYDKKYTYNVRGRNDRDVSHLLIRNY